MRARGGEANQEVLDREGADNGVEGGVRIGKLRRGVEVAHGEEVELMTQKARAAQWRKVS